MKTRFVAASFTLLALLAGAASSTAADRFAWFNLESDIHGVATYADANLVNPWGEAHLPDKGFWVASNGTGTLTHYDAAGKGLPLGAPVVVAVPPPAGAAQGATGAVTGLRFNYQAFGPNAATDFVLAPNLPSKLLLVTEDGTILGYNKDVDPTHAILKVTTPNAVYKGVALCTDGAGNHRLYAADFAGGKVDVFDNTFTPVTLPGTPFSDPVAGYAPFNIKHFAMTEKGKVHRFLIVAYAKNGAGIDEEPGDGLGYLSIFKPDGELVQRLVQPAAGNGLNAPWGMAIARHNGFNKGGVNVLVANHGDGTIHRFSLAAGSTVGSFSGVSHGTLNGIDNKPLVFDGLRGLRFRTVPRPDRLVAAEEDELSEDETTLYFTADIADGHGLFGRIVPRR